ncbi:PREDICTED: uncharacterized protein LOC104808366 [Tarenaya hassleriana]|uniref:uncharacterized protein LOC104808366 n=1 Tax=Tarenaya hassleriana TaxID=28532 RepID=UPI00053C5957|nr:PREDICTED: uncharacterized protein LOC104808366 [Tarenaya hassleriana]
MAAYDNGEFIMGSMGKKKHLKPRDLLELQISIEYIVEPKEAFQDERHSKTLQLSSLASVSDAIIGSACMAFTGCPNREDRRTAYSVAVHPATQDDGKDTALWKHKTREYRPCFQTSSTWAQIRQSQESVQWSRLVWFMEGSPRYSFVQWQAIQAMLPTKDRLGNAGPTILRVTRPGNNPEHGRVVIAKLISQAATYKLWRERNNRIFRGETRTIGEVRSKIDRIIRTRLLSVKLTGGNPARNLLLEHWYRLTLF